METKQTSVDFFLKEMSDIIGIVNTDAFQNLLMVDAYNKAKQMEKEQIKLAFNESRKIQDSDEISITHDWNNSEQYYNETYGPQVDKK
jgi:hypothetical protein